MGSLAYVAENFAGLRVIDVSNPALPVEIGQVGSFSGGWARDVQVVGDFAYLAWGSSGFRIYDVSDPTSPTLLSSLAIGNTKYIDVVGDRAYLSHGFGVTIVDVSDPSAPVASPPILGNAGPVASSGVSLLGDVMIADDSTWNVADPHEPFQLFDTPGVAGPVLHGGLVFGMAGGLRVADPSGALRAARSLGSVALAAGCSGHDIELGPGLAFVAADDCGVVIVDVSDLSNPVVLSTSLSGMQSLLHIELWQSGATTLVYGLAEGTDGLKRILILDASAPSSPTLLSETIFDAPINGFRVDDDGTYAFVGKGGGPLGGLLVFDVSDPGAPFLAGSEAGPASFLYLDDDRLYALDSGTAAIRILDVAVPAAPVEVGSVPGIARRFDVDGDLLFAAGSTVQSFNVADPSQPIALGSCSTATAPSPPDPAAARGTRGSWTCRTRPIPASSSASGRRTSETTRSP